MQLSNSENMQRSVVEGTVERLTSLLINTCDEYCLTSSGFCERQDILIPEGFFRESWAATLVRCNGKVAIRHQYAHGSEVLLVLSLGGIADIQNMRITKEVNIEKETTKIYCDEIVIDVETAKLFVRNILGVHDFDYTGIITISLNDSGNISTKELFSVFKRDDLR